MKTIESTVAFQDPQGNVVASGTLVLQLSQAAEITSGGGQVAPMEVRITLDATGKIPANTSIWANDQLTPSGTTYNAYLKDSSNAQVASFGAWSIAGASPIDLSAMVSTTSGASYPSAVLLNPSSAQTVATQPFTVTGNVTETAGQNIYKAYSFNTVLWVDGIKYTTIAGAYADLPSTGGCVMVPPNYSETVSADLSLSKAYSAIIFTGPANVNFGSHVISVPVGTHNVCIRSWLPMGSSTNTGGVYFTYTGSSTFLTVGASSADTLAFECSNISFQLTSAGSAAIGMKLVRTQDFVLDRLHFNGTGGAVTQQAIILDGTGNFTGGNIYYPKITGFLKGIQGTGSGAAAANANTILGGSISSPATGSSLGIDLQAGSAGNSIVGIDVEAHSVGYNIAGTSAGNFLAVRSETNTSGCTLGASTLENEVHLIDSSDPVTDSGTHNLIYTAGSTIKNAILKSATLNEASSGNAVTLLNLQDVSGPLTGNSSDQTIWTYILPANTLAAGKGVRVTFAVAHGTGTASVSYKIFFGATSVASGASTASTVYGKSETFNRPGITNGQRGIGYVLGGTAVAGITTGNSPAEDTTAAVTIKVTFNVANTDAVTGGEFIVELIQ